MIAALVSYRPSPAGVQEYRTTGQRHRATKTDGCGTMEPMQRVALITGGAKRVGRAIVQRLSDAGFAVAFTYHRSSSDAETLAHATGAIPIPADLTQTQTCVDIFTAFTSRFKQLDVLVNNASLYESASFEDSDVTVSRRLMAIHFESPLVLCQHFAPMLKQSRGHVINMLDLLVQRPVPKYMAYCASKAALWNLTLSLSRELAPQVTVNGIAPGVVDWPVEYPQADREKYLKRVPLARAGTPGDVAETVHFLATAAPYVTGQIIRLDGGRSVT
jgi:pteridine reductase